MNLDFIDVIIIGFATVWGIIAIFLLIVKGRPLVNKYIEKRSKKVLERSRETRLEKPSKTLDNDFKYNRIWYALICFLSLLMFFLPYIKIHIGRILSIIFGDISESITYTVSLYALFRHLAPYIDVFRGGTVLILILVVFFISLGVVMLLSETYKKQAFKFGFIVFLSVWIFITTVPLISVFFLSNIGSFENIGQLIQGGLSFDSMDDGNSNNYLEPLVFLLPFILSFFSFGIATYYGILIIIVWFILLYPEVVKEKTNLLFSKFGKPSSYDEKLHNIEENTSKILQHLSNNEASNVVAQNNHISIKDKKTASADEDSVGQDNTKNLLSGNDEEL